MTKTLAEIKDILGLGPDDWNARLRPDIKLISPNGDEFSGFWRGDARNKAKKIGLFDYTKIVGTIAQDLEMSSARYDFTFFFAGKDNDLDAARFWTSADQRGQWAVTHPVHGFLGLQMLSVSQQIQPITNGNITEVSTTWIEPIDPSALKTARQLAGITDANVKNLNLNAAQQFAENLKQTTETLRNTIQEATEIAVGLTDLALDPLFSTVDSLNNLVNGVQSSIQDTLNAVVLKPISLAGQIQQLTQLPLLATNDIASRLDYYNELAASIIGLTPETATEADKNKIACYESSLSALIGANAQIATTGALETRQQAVEFAEDISTSFATITDALDLAMANFEDNDIDRQYFSQSQSFVDAALATASAIEFLLTSSFDLKVEKRFVLSEPRAPIEITITEYGSLGENDENFDLFISSNRLKAEDILLLPAGREVVIYA